MKITLLVFFAVAVVRLVKIQILDAGIYQEYARKQYEAKVVLPSLRGNIYDRNGNILVSNSMFVSFAADPRIVGDDASVVAEKFSRVFGRSEKEYLQKLRSPRRFVWLERHVHPEVAKLLQMRNMDGVVELNETKRLYHYDEIGGQIVGCTNIDNVGMSGIEYEFDRELRGTDGYVVMQKDGLGRKRPSADYPRHDPVNGHSFVLTIDLNYQAVIEEELRKGVERTKSEAGLALMIRTATGEILAMAQLPSVNPNAIDRSEVQSMRIRAATDMYEPGSVFKIVVASAAIERDLVSPENVFFAEHGKYRVPLPGGRFRLIADTHESGNITFQEAMELSSNIVMAKVSDIVGAENLYVQARNYGFGMATGIELPGEIGGELKKPVDWSGTSLNSIAMGYEVGVTPLQLAMAYAAIANDGILMKPYIVRKEFDENGVELRAAQPQVIRRSVSQGAARTIRNFLVGVVERGTGLPAKVSKISIAGKTGTSRKYIDGKYEVGTYNASFVGFFPAEAPEILCLVMLEHPKNGGYTGGTASAPIFKGIAERILHNTGLLSGGDAVGRADGAFVAVPNVSNLEAHVAQRVIQEAGLDSKVVGKGDIVIGQFPSAGKRLGRGESIQLIVGDDGGFTADGSVRVPDVRGMSLRRAISRITMHGLDISVVGSGVVRNQSPTAGSYLKRGMKVTLVGEPRSLTSAKLY